MGIHRINILIVEEFGSPGDLRFRIETDIRLPRVKAAPGLHRRLRAAVETSRFERVRDLLLERLRKPLRGRHGGRVSKSDLIRVQRLVLGALSSPRKPVPPPPVRRGKR